MQTKMMSVPDAEFTLLRWSASALLDGAGAHEAPPFQPIDWHRLLWLGRRQEALLLLHESLNENPAARALCPSEIRAQLGELAAAARLQSLARAAEIARIHDVLAEHGISFASTDDWAFQQTIEGGSIRFESVSEIRGVVAPGCEERARELLVEAGHPDGGTRFQVTTDYTPVFLETGIDPRPGGSLLQLGNRRLATPSPQQWLWLLAARYVTSALTIRRAWQVIRLLRHLGPPETKRLARDDAPFGPLVRRLVQASHNMLGLPPLFATDREPEALSPKSSAIGASRELPLSPFLPTPASVAERMLILAGVGADDVVCDLGCGDGRLVIAAAKKFGARGFGIDRDPALLAKAAAQANAEGIGDKVSFICADLFSADVRAASVICFYLLPALCEPIRQRLLPHARAGTRVVSHDYSFPCWPPEKTELVRSAPARIAQIYLWRVGGNPAA